MDAVSKEFKPCKTAERPIRYYGWRGNMTLNSVSWSSYRWRWEIINKLSTVKLQLNGRIHKNTL